MTRTISQTIHHIDYTGYGWANMRAFYIFTGKATYGVAA